ncbi:MAG: hypothetical protein O3C38_05405 [Proteobacteria bacterium]|nr:hypothetical protein [Pseudomonadota bacterium]
MSFEEKIRQNIDKRLDAQDKIKEISKSLLDSALNKAVESKGLSEQVKNSTDPDERAMLEGQINRLDREATLYTEKAKEMDKNPEQYVDEYLKEAEKEDKEQTKKDTQNEYEKSQEEKPSEEIKKTLAGSGGILDQAFAEAFGAVVDTVAGHNNKKTAQQQSQTQEKEKVKTP